MNRQSYYIQSSLVLKLESDEIFMCVVCFKYEFSQHVPARSRNWSLNTLTIYPGMRSSPISSSGNSSPRRTPRSIKSRGASAAAAAGSQQEETTKSPRVSEKEGRTKTKGRNNLFERSKQPDFWSHSPVQKGKGSTKLSPASTTHRSVGPSTVLPRRPWNTVTVSCLSGTWQHGWWSPSIHIQIGMILHSCFLVAIWRSAWLIEKQLYIVFLG